MDHVALDGPGAHDGHLHDEVVELPWPHPGQHGHLRAALDLEHAQRVGAPDHGKGRRVLGRDGGEVEPRALVRGQQVQAAAQARQHPQGQAVDLHEAERADVVAVPLDDLPVPHGRGLDGHELVETVAGQHEAARVLGEVARHADELACEVKGQAQPAVGGVEVELLGVPYLHAGGGPAPDLGGERRQHVLGQPEGAAHVAHGAAGAVADDGGAERGPVPPVGVVDPLEDLLAPLVLEVDVDVGGLGALGRHEALEEKVRALGVDGRDAEREAHGRVRGRAPPLAEDAARASKADDGVDGEVMHQRRG